MKSKTVRILGLGALGVIAAVAIACGGSANDEDFASSSGSTGGFGVSQGAPADGDDSFGREPLSEKGVGSSAEEAPRAVADSAAGGGVAASPGGNPAGALQSIDRKIIQTASLQLQVEEVGVGFEEVGRIATAAGGFVASSSFSYRDGDEDQKLRQVASVTIRVPAEVYPGVLSQLRGLAETVDYEESNASDVTEEYTDLQSRLRNLEATETQLLRLLERANTITDILTVQDRLNNIQGEIEYVKGRLQLIGDLTDLATVSVHLRPVDGAPSKLGGSDVNLGETISEAWDDSLAFLGNIAEGVLTVVVFAWWVPVIGVPAGAIAYAANRRGTRAPRAVD
ncbi:MAG TPA: DUF4349 domain-containing protein [Dehalococcoidia bacterium]|nr:DUF4349 domain-containing protein [Dehalococcoidia bacterium]